jgi:tol-pal system protein YbgF
MRRFSWLALALLVVTTVISVPASAANREHQQMMADVRMLQEQTQQLRLQLAGVAEALRAVATKLDEQGGVARKAFADQKLLVDSLSGDLRVVREKVDDNNVRISSLSQDLEALRLAIPQTPPESTLGGDPSSGSPAVPAPAFPGLGVSAQRLFETAWNDFTSSQYTLAITGFETYIRTFPKLEQAGEAYYYIGEVQYAQGKYKDAVEAYDHVIADYPSSKIVPDAYYKRGVALNALGQIDRARESWEIVVKTYPTSDAGRLARQRLDQLVRK